MEHTMTETENSLIPRGVEIDISSEVYRLYRFPKGETVAIKKPKTLIVDEQGVHNVIDKEGYSHTISVGWIHLKFRIEKGASHFYFQKKKSKSEEKKKPELSVQAPEFILRTEGGKPTKEKKE